MKNKACVIINACIDCPHMSRTHHYIEHPINNSDFFSVEDMCLDDLFCEAISEDAPVLIAEALTVDDELNLNIPDWCPILKPEEFIISKPKGIKLKEENDE
jgi:hypothetical protein